MNIFEMFSNELKFGCHFVCFFIYRPFIVIHSASITKIEISLFDDENFQIFPDFFSRFPDNFLNDFLA